MAGADGCANIAGAGCRRCGRSEESTCRSRCGSLEADPGTWRRRMMALLDC